MTHLLKHFDRNTQGRDFVVGDIHGAFNKLRLTLEAIGFNENHDRLFSVGDLVDRGPQSEAYHNWLQKPWFHPVMGNHEHMAIEYALGKAPQDWYIRNGGMWNVSRTRQEQVETAFEFTQLPLAIEVETANGLVGIVHADVPATHWGIFKDTLSLRQPAHYLDAVIWSRSRISDENDTGVQGVRAVIVGHTPVPAMKTLGNVIYIDTGAYRLMNEFTILDLATLEPAKVTRDELKMSLV